MSYPVQEYRQQSGQPVSFQYASGNVAPLDYSQVPPPYYPQTGYVQSNPGVVTDHNNLPQFPDGESNADLENSEFQNWIGFTDKAIRRAFVRKVYVILLLQLLFTVGTISLFIFQRNLKEFVRDHWEVYLIAYVAFLVIYIMLVCCSKLRRNYPTNYILLFLFTLAFSYLAGTISSYHDIKEVLIAMGICASCCLGITLFSFQTKYDFTTWGGILFVLTWVLLMFGIVAALTFRTVNVLSTLYAAMGALLFMAYLAYDTQLIMGGKKYQLSAEEHVFAALQLYLDVVQIFLFILAIMGGGKK